jgi:hypothetical protein
MHVEAPVDEIVKLAFRQIRISSVNPGVDNKTNKKGMAERVVQGIAVCYVIFGPVLILVGISFIIPAIKNAENS